MTPKKSAPPASCERGRFEMNTDSGRECENIFVNYYRCDRCGHEWTDAWSCQCGDDCPNCGARHMSPYKSDDLPGGVA